MGDQGLLDHVSLAHVMTRAQPLNDAVAIVAGEVRTREQFLRDVAAWAQALEAQPGKRVALYTEDSYAFAAALMGAWQADKLVVLPGDAQPQTLALLASKVDCLAGTLPGAVQPAVDAPAMRAFKELDYSAHGMVVQTSGSSGEPLDIDKRLHQMDAEVRTLEHTFGAQLAAPGLQVHATVSHQHIYGLLFQVLWPLSAGRVLVAGRLEYPEAILAALCAQPCVLVASPAHLKRLPDTLPWQNMGPHCRAIFSSGGPLMPEASHAVHRMTGLSPIEVYGSSETGGIAWRQRATHADAWLPFDAVQWKVEDGVLEVASPNLPNGDFWQTSDRVRVLNGGRFELLGRADRIVKMEEKRVSLTALENALLACPEVAEAKVFPMEQAERMRLAAVIVPSASGAALLRIEGDKQGLTSGRKILSERLRAALLQGVERVALPRWWRFVEALPVNAQGKTTNRLLAALFQPEQPRVVVQEVSPQRVCLQLDMAPELSVFDGHFPNFALLPGVAQVDWAITLGQVHFGITGKFLRVEILKFQVPIRPNAQVTLELQWDAAKHALRFAYHTGEVRHSSGRVVFSDGGAHA